MKSGVKKANKELWNIEINSNLSDEMKKEFESIKKTVYKNEKDMHLC